jgi:hypothetical protein
MFGRWIFAIFCQWIFGSTTLRVDEYLGWQIYGLMSIRVDNFTGWQIFGSTNIWVDEYSGWQLYGLTNIWVNKYLGWWIFKFTTIRVDDFTGRRIFFAPFFRWGKSAFDETNPTCVLISFEKDQIGFIQKNSLKHYLWTEILECTLLM